MLVCCGFIPQHKASRTNQPTKNSSELYTEAIKALLIRQDTTAAINAIEAIFQQDSNYAPALSLLSRIHKDPQLVTKYAKRAYLADTTNRYYLEQYGYALLDSERALATPIFEKIVQYSTNLNDYRILSILLFSNNKTSEAIAILDSAEMRLGHNPIMAKFRINLLIDSGQTLKAEAEAKKAIKAAPYVAQNHVLLANIYEKSGRDSLALVSYHNAIAIDSLDVDSWMALSFYYSHKEDIASHLSVLLRVFANPTFSVEKKLELWTMLAEDKELYRKFYTLYDTIITQLHISYPENETVSRHYIGHLMVSGKGEEASRMSKTFLQTGTPSIADIELVLFIESQLERPDSVAHYIDFALKCYPNNPRFLRIHSNLAENRQEYDTALKDLYSALAYADEGEMQGDIYINIGRLERMRNNMKSYRKAQKMALKCFAHDDILRSQTYAIFGDIEHAHNNMKGCYKAYQKALKLNADNSHVLNNYAYFLSLEDRKLEQALEMATLANELDDNNPTFLDTKAWILYKLGRYAEAKKVMQQALSLDRSNDPTFSLHYGDILYALGEKFMAEVYWRKALERGADKEEIEKRFLPQNPKEK